MAIKPLLQEIQWNSINFSEIIDSGKRLDGSSYDIEVKNAKRLVESSGLKIKPLLNHDGFLSRAYFPTRFKRTYVHDGIPFLGSSEILQINPTPKKFLSRIKHAEQKEILVKENWILISRSGTVGNIAFSTKQFDGMAISEHVIRLITKDFEDAACLYIYLKTSFAQKMIFGSQFGSVVDEIDPKNFDKIPVPIPPPEFKKKIAYIVKKINELRIEVSSLLQKADTLLHEHIKLDPLESIHPKYFGKTEFANYEINLNKLNLRLDGSYHIPLISELEKQLKKSGCEITKIADERISEKTILPGRFKRIYVEKEYGVPFLSSKQILLFDLSRIKYLSKINHDKRIEKELTLHENMVLITCSGTIGNVMLAPKYFDSWTASQHVIRIIPSKKMNPGYLYAYLASDYGHELITRYTYGSVVDELSDHNVEDIPIPLPDQNTMNQIGNPVLKANSKLTEAFQLEQDAINQFESLILKIHKD